MRNHLQVLQPELSVVFHEVCTVYYNFQNVKELSLSVDLVRLQYVSVEYSSELGCKHVHWLTTHTTDCTHVHTNTQASIARLACTYDSFKVMLTAHYRL